MLAKIISLVYRSYHVNAINQANCDILSSKFMINQIRDFEKAASLYDYPCVVVLKKVFIVISTISEAQTLHRVLLHFAWGEGLFSGYAMCDANKIVLHYILCNYVYVFIGVLITTTNHIITHISYRYPRTVCLFALQVPSSVRKGTLANNKI